MNDSIPTYKSISQVAADLNMTASELLHQYAENEIEIRLFWRITHGTRLKEIEIHPSFGNIDDCDIPEFTPRKDIPYKEIDSIGHYYELKIDFYPELRTWLRGSCKDTIPTEVQIGPARVIDPVDNSIWEIVVDSPIDNAPLPKLEELRAFTAKIILTRQSSTRERQEKWMRNWFALKGLNPNILSIRKNLVSEVKNECKNAYTHDGYKSFRNVWESVTRRTK